MIDIKNLISLEKKSCGLCCTKINNFNVTLNKTAILENIDLHIHCGQINAVIGPNGAGKSTLLKAILNQIKHTGEMKFLDNKELHTGRPVIGYVPQYLNFDHTIPVSVLDFVASSVSSFPVWIKTPAAERKAITAMLKTVQADYLADQKLGNLSGGELQRVLLALSLYPLPDLLLLDEPASGIDKNGLTLFYKIISQLKKQLDLSVILVSHDLEFVAKYADKVILLNKKILQAGTPYDVYQSSEFSELFGSFWFKGIFDKKG